MRVLMSVTTWDATALRFDLEQHGFAVTSAEEGEELLDCLHLLKRPVVLLETDLPDMDWGKVLMRLRRENPNMSIIILNSADRYEDLLKGFELGADDVVSATTPVGEVAARIRAIALRRAGRASQGFNIGPLQLRLAERRAYWGTTRIHLSPSEYAMFQTLCLAAPNVIGKDVLMAEMYGIEEGCDVASLSVYISNLRDRIVAAGAPRGMIETVRGRGYRVADPGFAALSPMRDPEADYMAA